MEFNYNGRNYNVSSILDRMEHKEKIREQLNKIKDDLVFEDSGMTVYTKSKSDIKLSKGCQACKNGSWWCLYVGNNCNKQCSFCPQEKTYEQLHKWDHPRSITSYWIDDVKFYLDKFGDKLTGVSYSGGEPLMYLDKIIEIGEYIQKTHSEIYQWAYTNGVFVNEERLKKLKNSGIKEVRVDLAATEFEEDILNKLQLIKKVIGKVTVEVPSIPEVFIKLVNEKLLDKLVDSGVEQLNLAELELKEDINWQAYATNEDIYLYDSPQIFSYAPVYSRQLTLFIMEYAIQNKLDILINDCSLDTKHLQGLMRNQNAPLATR